MQEIKKVLIDVIKKLYGIDFEPEISVAPENIDADYSSNAPLKLAREIHKAPMEIAREIETNFEGFSTMLREIETSSFVRGLESEKSHTLDSRENRLAGEPLGVVRNIDFSDSNLTVTLSKEDVSISEPGFVNFKLAEEYLAGKVSEVCEDFEGSVKFGKYNGKTVICEFSDPNPFKVLHVGHLYTSVVGDAISRLFEYAGAKVVRANFGGDVGLHVAKTMYILMQKDIDELTIEDIAKCYVEGTAAYEDDENAKAKITELNKEIYKINADNLHDTKLAEVYWKGRELSYKYFEQFYNSIGVKFDKYYPESTVAELGLLKVREQLEQGVYEMSDGAVIFDGEKFGLHTRVFINREGVPTYETKDVGLIFTKWEDYHFDKSVVITGSEQLDYMKVVLKSVEQYASELVKKTSHLTHGLVKLPGNVKMSSRKGNFLKAVDVIDMVKAELKNEYDSDDKKVALAALKYAFLKYKMGGNIVFDPKESVKMTGNSGPYLLYSAVRAKKILVKAGVLTDSSFSGQADSFSMSYTGTPAEPSLRDEPVGSVRNIHLKRANLQLSMKKTMSVTPAERRLVIKLLEYRSILDECVTEMAPHKLANYLYELAQKFSRFYESCPVVGGENENERINYVKVYLGTMMHGLNILGIEVPEEM